MLCGQVPFQGARGGSPQSRAADIIHKIKEGDFVMQGESWEHVSDEAKELVKGRSLMYLKSMKSGLC